MQAFAAAHINDLRIRNRHCDSADRTGRLIVKNRLPGSPIVCRFEDAAIHLRHVKNIWLRGNPGDRTSPTAAERSDVAPSQRVIKTRVGGERARCNGGEQYRQTRNKKSYTSHMEPNPLPSSVGAQEDGRLWRPSPIRARRASEVAPPSEECCC